MQNMVQRLQTVRECRCRPQVVRKKEDWTEVSKEQLAEVKLPASFDKLKEQKSYFYHGENISDYELVQTAVALGKMELPTDEKKCIPDRVAMDAFEVLVRDQAGPKTHGQIHCIRKMENILLQRLKAVDGRCI